MISPHTSFRRALRLAAAAWLALLLSLASILMFWVVGYVDYPDLLIITSIVAAIVALLLGIYSLLLTSSFRAWGAVFVSALILMGYGLLIYVMRDFCVIC